MMIVVVLRSKRDAVKSFLMKLGVALTVTVAGFIWSQFRRRKLNSLPPPINSERIAAAGLEELTHQVADESSQEETPKIIQPARAELFPNSNTCIGDENLLLPDFNELLLKDFEDLSIHSSQLEVEDWTQMSKELEIIDLRNMVQFLRERGTNLETEMLEYYGLKEQDSMVQELRSQLKANTMETKLLSLKIESLVADNRKLQSQIDDHSLIQEELESARAVIKHLTGKLISEGEQHEERLCILRQRVEDLRVEEHPTHKIDLDVKKKLEKLQGLEDELTKLRNVNSELHSDNLCLVAKLNSTKTLASPVLNNSELKILEENANHLKEANEDMEKEIEQLRMDRCADAEELVYLKWVNACLRYELRNFYPSQRKPGAKELNRSSSPTSHEKAKALILEYANSGIDESKNEFLYFGSGYYTSSHESTVTDAGDCDENFSETSPANHNHGSRKPKFLGKLRRLLSRKGDHNNPHEHKMPHFTATSSINSASSSITVDRRTKSFSLPQFSTHKLGMDDKKLRKSTTDFMNKPISPAEIQRQRRLSLDETRQDELEYRFGYEISEQGEDSNKSELMKYAHALQRSRQGLNIHRRTVSFDFP